MSLDDQDKFKAQGALSERNFQPETIARQIQAGFRLLLLSGHEPILAAGCRKILDNLSPWRG